MKTCPKCGAQLPDEATICNVCGAPLDAAQDTQQNFNQQYNPYQGQPQFQQYQQPAGATTQKGMGIVAYIGWIGFIIAICAGDKNDPYLKFHLNQSLVLNLFSLLGMIPLLVGSGALLFSSSGSWLLYQHVRVRPRKFPFLVEFTS